MPIVSIPNGETEVSVEVPDTHYGETLRPSRVPVMPKCAPLLAQSLDKPIGSPRLEKIARGVKSVAIVVDDYTRPTPVAQALPFVLERLDKVGIGADQITIVFALGTHRAMTNAEIRTKLGDTIAGRYPVVNKSVYDAPDYRYLEKSRLDIPIWMLAEVVDADLRVGIGSIAPHCDVG